MKRRRNTLLLLLAFLVFPLPAATNQNTQGTYSGLPSVDVMSAQGENGSPDQGTCMVGEANGSTILQPATTAQSHADHFLRMNGGNISNCMENLAIQDSTQGGTARRAEVGDITPSRTRKPDGPVQDPDHVRYGIVLQVRTVDNVNSAGWAGTDAGAWINSAEADLPDTGGIIDARGLTGAQTFTTGIVLTKRTRLLLGAGTYFGPPSGDVISVQGGSGSLNQGTCIVGEAKNLTIIQPVTTAQANGIYFSPTNNGNAPYCVENMTIQDSAQGGGTRTAGAGIIADANPNPAQNSSGLIQNVDIYNMYYGIVLNRPLATKIIRSTVTRSKQDGFVLQGDGTTVSLDSTYARFSGRHDYAQHGVTAVTYNNPAAQNALGDGIHIDRQNGTSGQQALGISIISPDIEAEGGKGIYCLDCIGMTVTGMGILNTTGDGIHIDGGRGVNLIGGQIKGASGCGVNVTTSATPAFPGVIINQGTQVVASASGDECGDALSAYDSFGYVGSNLYRLNRDVQLGAGSGVSPATPLTFFENTAPSGQSGVDRCYGDSAEHALMCSYNNDPYYSATRTIASGTVALGTSAIPAKSCASEVLVVASGVTATDTLVLTPSGPPAANYASLSFSNSYPASGSINIMVCNPTSAVLVPGAATVNWRVTR